MSLISVIVRQFVLPNPFECFGEKAVLINWIAEPIIQAIAYLIVGLFYVKGSAPALGSLAYLAVYAACIGVLWSVCLCMVVGSIDDYCLDCSHSRIVFCRITFIRGRQI